MSEGGDPQRSLGGGPLSGLRAIEFGQLLAGPFAGTLLGDFGAEVIKVEPPGTGDAMRDWGRLRHNDHCLWWSILARNKRSVTLNLREPEGQRDRRRAARRPPTSCSRTSGPARWRSGASAPRTSTRVNPRGIYARVSGYGQTGRYATARVRLRGRGALGPALHQRLPRPGAAAGRDQPRRHARRPVGLPGHPARPLRPRARASRPGGRRGIVDACFAMTESSSSSTRRPASIREPTGPRLPRIAPSNVYLSSDGSGS